MTMLKTGRPSTKDKAIEAVSQEKEQMHKINFDVNTQLYKQIKVYAAQNGIHMKDLLIKSVLEYMRKNSNT